MKRVLVVDDDHDVLESLELVLSRRYKVRTASGGSEALESLATGAFDVALIDLMMPGMDGEEVVRQMRRRGIGLPVIIASATVELATSEDIDVFAKLRKPFGREELEARIEEAIRSGGGTDGTSGSGAAGPLGGADEPGGTTVHGSRASARTRHRGEAGGHERRQTRRHRLRDRDTAGQEQLTL